MESSAAPSLAGERWPVSAAGLAPTTVPASMPIGRHHQAERAYDLGRRRKCSTPAAGGIATRLTEKVTRLAVLLYTGYFCVSCHQAKGDIQSFNRLDASMDGEAPK